MFYVCVRAEGARPSDPRAGTTVVGTTRLPTSARPPFRRRPVGNADGVSSGRGGAAHSGGIVCGSGGKERETKLGQRRKIESERERRARKLVEIIGQTNKQANGVISPDGIGIVRVTIRRLDQWQGRKPAGSFVVGVYSAFVIVRRWVGPGRCSGHAYSVTRLLSDLNGLCSCI